MSHDTQDLVIAVFCHLAKENDKSVDRIIHLLLVVQKKDLVQRFWDIIDETLPGHHFESVGCCPDCGSFELV